VHVIQSEQRAAAGTRALRGARPVLLLLLLINLFNYMDRQILSAAVGPIKASFFSAVPGIATRDDFLSAIMAWSQRNLGFKPEDALVGLLGTAFLLMYMIGAPIFGRLAERHSRWMLIGAGVIIWSLATGASGMALTFAALLVTRCFVGIGEAAYGPVAPSIIADLYPLQSRGRMLAWFYMAIPVGSALGYVLGGFIANSGIGAWLAPFTGEPPESWRWAFYLAAIPGLLLGIGCLFMRVDPRGRNREPSAHWADYREFFTVPSYTLCTLGMAAMTFAIGGIAFWMPYYLETRPGAPVQSTFYFGLITVVAGLSATLAGGFIADWLRPRLPSAYFVVSGLAMFTGFPFFLAALYAPFPWIWVFIFLAIFCLFFNTGPTNTILANVIHPAKRPAAFALNIFVIHALGDVISPVVIGLLSDRFHDLGAAFLSVGFVILLAGILWLAGGRHLVRDTVADA
jgi:MFS family permease